MMMMTMLRTSLSPRGTPMWRGRGSSSEILNLTPKIDQSGRGRSLYRLLIETSLKYRQIKITVTANDGKDLIIEYFSL